MILLNLLAIKDNLRELMKVQDGTIDATVTSKIPEIIALLFAIFTIQDTQKCLYKNQKNGEIKNNENLLLKPHDGQIIALFRILGLGHPQINSKIVVEDEFLNFEMG